MSKKQYLIATSDVPFIRGGHLELAEALVHAFRSVGHRADLLLTPQNRMGKQFSAYLATRLTDVEFSGDVIATDGLVSMRYPSYALKHPNHVCWLTHRMREYYDLWEFFSGNLRRRAKLKEAVRRFLVHKVDRYLLTRNVKHLFVLSETIRERLKRWGGIDCEVLPPPPPLRPYRNDGPGDFIFTVSRLHPLKRVDLLIRALAASEDPALKCVIAGEGESEAELRTLASELGVDQRVRFLGRVGEDELVDLYAKCRAVFFAPLREDYGFVTVESFRSGKPVVTCADSGGTLEFVEDGITGFICDPLPEALARACTQLTNDSGLAQKLGQAGEEKVRPLTWEATAARILSVMDIPGKS